MADHPEPAVQLFSVREGIDADPARTLAGLRRAGWHEVEPYGFGDDPAWWVAALGEAGLVAPSAHTDLLGADVGATAAAAAAAGIRMLIDPSVDEGRWDSRESIGFFARALAEAAEAAADQGVSVGYHNHHDEIRRTIDGVTALEVLADELGRLGSTVELQLDVYWVAAAGADPVVLLDRLGERVTSLHLKDGPGRGGDHEQVGLGAGDQPLAAILRSAPHARRIVELDTVSGDLDADLADSLAWLREHDR